MNVPRTRELLVKVYHAHTAARHRPMGWIDVPSENIPATYAYLYQVAGADAGQERAAARR